MFYALLTPFGEGVPDAVEDESLIAAGALPWSRGRPLKKRPDVRVNLGDLGRPLPAVLNNAGAVPILSRELVNALDGARFQLFPVDASAVETEYLAVNFLDKLKNTVDLEASEVTLDPLSTVVTFLEGFSKLVLQVDDPPPAFRIQEYDSFVILREDVGRRVVAARLPGLVCLPLNQVRLGSSAAPDASYCGL